MEIQYITPFQRRTVFNGSALYMIVAAAALFVIAVINNTVLAFTIALGLGIVACSYKFHFVWKALDETLFAYAHESESTLVNRLKGDYACLFAFVVLVVTASWFHTGAHLFVACIFAIAAATYGAIAINAVIHKLLSYVGETTNALLWFAWSFAWTLIGWHFT